MKLQIELNISACAGQTDASACAGPSCSRRTCRSEPPSQDLPDPAQTSCPGRRSGTRVVARPTQAVARHGRRSGTRVMARHTRKVARHKSCRSGPTILAETSVHAMFLPIVGVDSDSRGRFGALRICQRGHVLRGP